MKSNRFSRRNLLAAGGAAALAGGVSPVRAQSAGAGSAGAEPFRYCLNTGTIRGQKLSFDKEVEIAAKAGYDGIEPWVDNINNYARSGGSLKDLKKKIAELGLTVESGISFPSWIVDDDARRAKGLEQAKRDMDTLAQVGGIRIAAPPAGATREPGLDLDRAAERYRALLEAGDQIGVVPQIELWGSSRNLHLIGQCMYVVIESGHPNACFMPDVFHIYRGGSEFDGLRLLSSRAIRVFHMNDYPADPPREKINDGHRVMPGDGVAPLTGILRNIRPADGQVVLSLELFNRDYWRQDALTVAKIGLEKMKAAVRKALTPD